MEKISLPSIVAGLAGVLLAVLAWSGNYVLDNLTAQIKGVDSRLDLKLGTIDSRLKEHGDSLLRIRAFLYATDPKYNDVVMSIDKLKPLNQEEFYTLKAALEVTTHDKNAEA